MLLAASEPALAPLPPLTDGLLTRAHAFVEDQAHDQVVPQKARRPARVHATART